MKVLFLSRLYPPSLGGMQRFAYDLGNALEKQGSEVKKLTFGGSLWWQPLVIPYLAVRAIMSSLTRRYDVIHLQDATVAWVGWIIRKLTGTPYVVVVHGLDVTYPMWIYQKATPYFLKHADFIVCNSEATQHEVLSRGIDPAICQVTTLGVHGVEGDVAYTRAEIGEKLGVDITPETKILLTVGRLVKRKGLEWFIDKVMPDLVKDHPAVVLVSVGKGPERLAIEMALTRNKLRKNVKLAGPADDALRDSLYRHADLFVMPNIKVPGDMEGFGIVAIEAASSGLPVIASDIEGISDALSNGKNGYLIESGDARSFHREIERIIADDQLRVDFSETAKRFTKQKYGWDTVASEYMKVYERVTRSIYCS